MSPEIIAAIILAIVGLTIAAGLIWLRLPKKLKSDDFTAKWRELQKLCRDKTTWPNAIEQADRLLDTALKKRKFKGNSMGERMVSAQRTFTNNDMAWFAHNLYKKITSDPNSKLKESEVKDALVGFRQALRDLGALPKDSQDLKVKK